MKLFIDIVMKRIYLFNIVAWNYRKKNRISGLQKGKFRRPWSAPEARKERSCQSYSASHIKWRAERSFHRPTFIRPGSQKPTALFWLSEVNDGLTLRLKDINSLARRTSLGKNNNKYKRIGYQRKPSPTSPMVQIWVLICWEWSSTIAKIWDASGKTFVSDYSRRSETFTISSFR